MEVCSGAEGVEWGCALHNSHGTDGGIDDALWGLMRCTQTKSRRANGGNNKNRGSGSESSGED